MFENDFQERGWLIVNQLQHYWKNPWNNGISKLFFTKDFVSSYKDDLTNVWIFSSVQVYILKGFNSEIINTDPCTVVYNKT